MEHRQEAMEKMSLFLCAGRPEKPGPKLLDWEHDAPLIVADVNRVAGTEVRSMEFLHWWTFLGWFHALGEGQLSTVVAIRGKLARGKKLRSVLMNTPHIEVRLIFIYKYVKILYNNI